MIFEFIHLLFLLNSLKFLDTGELLRCDVILNHIHTIQIAMKTRELFIEDAPEEFYARASDDQGIKTVGIKTEENIFQVILV